MTWHRQAACKGQGDLFFAKTRDRIGEAKAICATCPVFDECREAVTIDDRGVWAGTTTRERTLNRQNRNRRIDGSWVECEWCGQEVFNKAQGKRRRFCTDACSRAKTRAAA